MRGSRHMPRIVMGPSLAQDLAIRAALLAVALPFRFLTGRVVTRPQSRWDARYSTWAPPMPDTVRLSPLETFPRTTWARRPGWHRQAVRFGALLALVVLLVWPLVGAAGVAVAVVWRVWRAVEAWRWRRVYGPVVEPWGDYVAAKIGTEGIDPRQWVRFPGDGWVWEPVAPLAWLARDDGALARRAPAIARRVAAIATPVGEQGWTVRAREAASVDGAPAIARVLGRLAAVAVVVVERSRVLRVRPRRVRADLAGDDARIEIEHPPAYPAHGEDVRVIGGVMEARLPGEWQIESRARDLLLVLVRPRRMPSTVTMTRRVWAEHDQMTMPIGGDANGTVTVPLKGKTPHVSVAASTGWGKTVTANVMASFLLWHGWSGTILDPKRVGFIGAFRNASVMVELRTTLEGQIRAILAFYAEMERRYQIMEDYLDRVDDLGLPPMRDNPEMYFQPCFLLEDEKGSLTVALRTWWKREGGGRKLDDGTVIPWFDALGTDAGSPVAGKGDPEPIVKELEILWRGRAAAMHMLTLAQQNNLNVFLNSDMRDQYMMRILSGPQTQSSWIMTFPGVKRRRVQAKKGRAMYGIGPQEPHEMQLGMVTDDEARASAYEGEQRAEELNRERAERLAKVTGRPLWEVSPCPPWVRTPAQTPSDVPGRAGSGDAPAARPGLALVTPSAGSTDEPETADETVGNGSPGDAHEITPEIVEDAPAPVAVDAEDVPADTPESNASSTVTQAPAPDLVVGVAAAAEHLGLSEAAFVKRRKRAKATGGIPGETREGRQPAWPRIELEEWSNTHRAA